MLQLTKPLAFIDLETTGINLGNDRIIEIAIVNPNFQAIGARAQTDAGRL